MGTYVCQRPVHPGEILKEEVECRHTRQTRLAEQMGIPYKVLNDLLNGRRALTPATALMFEAALGVDAGLLMRMQVDYSMQVAGQDQALRRRLRHIREAATA